VLGFSEFSLGAEALSRLKIRNAVKRTLLLRKRCRDNQPSIYHTLTLVRATKQWFYKINNQPSINYAIRERALQNNGFIKNIIIIVGL
jgi:hypothetical protein